jgi:hypothetical protein
VRCVWVGGGKRRYMSGLACCHAAEAGNAPAAPATARGATSSRTRGWCHASAGACEGSERQSMSAREPRTSATRRSLVVVECAQTELSACGNEITYAVGCGREFEAGEESSSSSSSGEGDSGAEGMSTIGWRSQTMSILSSVMEERGYGRVAKK